MILKVRVMKRGGESEERVVYPPESAYIGQQWRNFQRTGRWEGRQMVVQRRTGDTLVLAPHDPGRPARDRRTGCVVRDEYSTLEHTVLELDAPGLVPLVDHLTRFGRHLAQMDDPVEGFRLAAIDRASGMVFMESEIIQVAGPQSLHAIHVLGILEYMVTIWVEQNEPSPRAVALLAGSYDNEYQPLFDQCFFRLEFINQPRGGGGGTRMRGLQVLKKRRLVVSPQGEGENDCFFHCLIECKAFPEKYKVGDSVKEWCQAARTARGWELDRLVFANEAIHFMKTEKIPYRLMVMYREEREDRLYQEGEPEQAETCALILYRGHYYLDRGESQAPPVCPDCHAEHLPSQTCVAARVRYWQRREKGDPSETTAYYDLETRNDLENAIVTYEKEAWKVSPTETALLPTRRVVYRQIPTAVSIYYQEHTDTYLGLDCLDRLFVWADQHPKVLKLLAHNGARFDSLLVREYAVAKGWSIQNLIQANGRLLAMTIKGIEFGCTFRFLPRGLKAIGKDFQVEEEKMSEVPIEKQEDGLRTMDDLLLFKKEEWTPTQYLKWIQDDSSWGKIYSDYCGLDSRVLGKAWQKFRAAMQELFARMYEEGKQFRGKPPSTAIDSFTTLPQMVYAHWKFQTNTRAKLAHVGSDPITLPKAIYDFYRLFIIGGRSQQVPGYYREPLLYMDVVSLYPCVQSIYPYPTRKFPEVYVTEYQPDSLGVYCIRNLEWPKAWQEFNPFPARDEKGHRLFWNLPGVKRTLLVTSVDLMMAEEVGATYEVVWGYVWLRTWNPFAEFMNFFVQVKKGEDAKPREERNQAMRQAAKLCLVSLYGKMAQAPPKYEYEEFDVEKGAYWELHPPKKRNEVAEFQKYQSWKSGDMDVVSMQQHGSLYRVFRRPTYQENENRKYHPAHYGVFILAWSRYHMFQYARRLRNPDTGVPEIYGSETDSLITPWRYKSFLEQEGPSYSFEEFLAQCPYKSVPEWRRYWSKHKDGIFRFGSEIGNIVDEVASAGEGRVERALLVQPKTYALQLVKPAEESETGKEEIHWHMRWKGVPTKTRDGKEIIRLGHYIAMLQYGGVSFVRLTQFLRIQDDIDRLPGVAVAEIAKTIVRPRELKEKEEQIWKDCCHLDPGIPMSEEYKRHMDCLQRERTAYREFGRMRAMMEEEEKAEVTLIRDRFRRWFEHRKEESARMAAVPEDRPEGRWKRDRVEYEQEERTWEERWENAFALMRTGQIREEDIHMAQILDELQDYDQEEEDEFPRCPFVEDLADECRDEIEET
jgi:hypothetical protein